MEALFCFFFFNFSEKMKGGLHANDAGGSETIMAALEG